MRFLLKPTWNTLDIITIFIVQVMSLAGYWYLGIALLLTSIPFSVYYQQKYWKLHLKENN